MATFLYNPERKPKNALIAEFVVRTEIYDEIMHDLENSKMDHPEQHYLLVGQRGAGKTTLLNRIKYGIEDSKALKDRVIPVIFSEEQYNISELVNLWESVAQHLEDYYGFEGLYDAIEANQAKNNFEELSYDILEKQLKKKKKKMVLLIDNIGDMLKKMEKTEVHRLREILQTRSEMRFIVGSPFYLETVLDYHQPFFEFFKVLRLDGLNEKETQDLLLKLGEVNGGKEKIEKIIKETPERIETLRTLTGGVPRTIALMFNIFIEYNSEDTVEDLEKILDAVTPLYKHRMDDLPTQQQKIVDAVARNWDGISVKELRGKVRIESKTISAQLRQLEKNQVIETVETNTKNNLYFLRERFFNIWYLMRYGRKYDRQRVIWLVKFLESWCSVNEIEQRILDYVSKIEKGKLNEELVSFYGEVYAAMENIRTEMKVILKESTPKYLSRKIKIEPEEILRIAAEHFKNKEFEKGLELIKQVTQPDPSVIRTMTGLFLQMSLSHRDYFLTLFSKTKNKLQQSKALVLYEWIIIVVTESLVCFLGLARNNFEAAHRDLEEFLESLHLYDEELEPAINAVVGYILLLFIMFEQNNIVYSLFDKNPEWKDKFKPIYYTLLKSLEKNEEVLKMPKEIIDPGEDIFQRVEVARKAVITFRNKVSGNIRVHE